MTVGEAFGVTLEQTPDLVDERRHELNMIFNFDAVRLAHPGLPWIGWTLPKLKAIYTEQDQKLDVHSWNTIFLSNHDNPRVVSTFGDDAPEWRVPSAKLLATMLLTLKGTPFIYQGDELGMTNYPFKSLEDFDDIEVKNAWKERVETKQIPADYFLEQARRVARDNSRTPMQWDEIANGGFTAAAKPWLAVNPNYKEINAKQESAIRIRSTTTSSTCWPSARPRRPLRMGRTRISIRRTRRSSLTRARSAQRYLVVLNFSRDAVSYSLPDGLEAGKLLISNLGTGKRNRDPGAQRMGSTGVLGGGSKVHFLCSR